MTGRHALASLVLAATMLAGASDAARAQCRLCSTPTTERPDEEKAGALRLEVEASLDFDRLVLLGSGSGAATLLPNGERSASGSVASLSGRAQPELLDGPRPRAEPLA